MITGGGRGRGGGGCLLLISRLHLNMNYLKWRLFFFMRLQIASRDIKVRIPLQPPRGCELLLRGPPGAAAFIRSANMKPLR